METPITISAIILSFLFLVLIICFIIQWILGISIFFLSFKLEKYPKMIKTLEDFRDKILADEGISFVVKTYDELNKGLEEKIVGCYYHTSNTTPTVIKMLELIDEIEKTYNETIEEFCKKADRDIIKREDYVYPRIEVSYDKNSKWQFHTIFHEIGHHFKTKEKGEHTELEADQCAYLLLKENLPLYYSLIIPYSGVNPSYMEKLKAFYYWLKDKHKNV